MKQDNVVLDKSFDFAVRIVEDNYEGSTWTISLRTASLTLGSLGLDIS